MTGTIKETDDEGFKKVKKIEKTYASWYHKFMLMLCGRTGYTWYNTLFTVRMVSGLFESNLVAREVENSDEKIKHSGWYI